MDARNSSEGWFAGINGSARQGRTHEDVSHGPVAYFRHAQSAISGCLALALAACAPPPTSAPPPSTSTHAISECPAATFDAFIERFGREISFQELTTADPLVVERYDSASEPEPRRVVEEVALADVVWPVMPRLDMLSRGGRTYDITRIADGSVEVQVRRPDTSEQQRYVFRQSPCWQLQRVVDESV